MRPAVRALLGGAATAALVVLGARAGARGADAAEPPREFEASAVDLLGWFPPSEFEGLETAATDVVGLVSGSGREYAVVGFGNKTGFVEITHRDAPAIVAVVPHSYQATSDQAVYRDRVYVVTGPGGGGVQILDVSAIDDGVVTVVGFYTGEGEIRISSARSIAIDPVSGFAYLIGGDSVEGGLVILDLSDPDAPEIAATWGREAEDVSVVTYGPDSAYPGRQIAFLPLHEFGFTILDVTDKSDLEALTGDVTYPNLTWCVQCRPSEDLRHLFVADERDEIEIEDLEQTTTYVFDIADPAAPAYLRNFSNGVGASDHNLYVREPFIFEANYASGLRVLDASDIQNVTEVGWFDTYPEANGTGVGFGAYGVYAGFPSGLVAVTDLQHGLFVLEPISALPIAYVAVEAGAVADPGEGQGAAWVDVDADLDLDIYITNGGGPNRLLRNDGAVGYADVSAPPVDDAGDGRAGVWADIDGDRDLDLFLVNAGGPDRLVRNDGVSGFADVTTPSLADPESGRGAAWSDFDRDGDLDLYVANFGAPHRLYRNDGLGGFDAIADSAGVGGEAQTMGVAWADWDLDGDPDLSLTSFGGPDRLYRNDGAAFVEIDLEEPAATTPGVGLDWGDYDGDDDDDLVVANFGAPDVLYRNDGGNFADVTAAAGMGGGSGQSVSVAFGDHDRDGWLDLYVSDLASGIRLWRNRGDRTFTDLTGRNFAGAGSPVAFALADDDVDGDLDLFATNAAGVDHLYRNETAPPRHWLEVRLSGRSGNTHGIGARVHALSGGRRQVREIRAGSGYLAQSPPVAHFGLGAATIADTIRVFWPSGAVSDTASIAADQLLDLVEPGATPIDGEMEPPGMFIAAPRAPRLFPVVPNPFNPQTRIVYELPVRSPVRLVILDAAGRCVRVLAEGEAAAGRYTLQWSGEDDDGRPVASGTYFVLLQAGHVRTARSLTVVR